MKRQKKTKKKKTITRLPPSPFPNPSKITTSLQSVYVLLCVLRTNLSRLEETIPIPLINRSPIRARCMHVVDQDTSISTGTLSGLRRAHPSFPSSLLCLLPSSPHPRLVQLSRDCPPERSSSLTTGSSLS